MLIQFKEKEKAWADNQHATAEQRKDSRDAMVKLVDQRKRDRSHPIN